MSFICRDEWYGAARLADQSKCGHKVVFVGKSWKRCRKTAANWCCSSKLISDKHFFHSDSLYPGSSKQQVVFPLFGMLRLCNFRKLRFHEHRHNLIEKFLCARSNLEHSSNARTWSKCTTRNSKWLSASNRPAVVSHREAFSFSVPWFPIGSSICGGGILAPPTFTVCL